MLDVFAGALSAGRLCARSPMGLGRGLLVELAGLRVTGESMAVGVKVRVDGRSTEDGRAPVWRGSLGSRLIGVVGGMAGVTRVAGGGTETSGRAGLSRGAIGLMGGRSVSVLEGPEGTVLMGRSAVSGFGRLTDGVGVGVETLGDTGTTGRTAGG